MPTTNALRQRTWRQRRARHVARLEDEVVGYALGKRQSGMNRARRLSAPRRMRAATPTVPWSWLTQSLNNGRLVWAIDPSPPTPICIVRFGEKRGSHDWPCTAG
jgi:hypothetical protein